MIDNFQTKIKYLNQQQIDLLLEKLRDDKKYTCIVLLMLDAGLRVSEAVSMTFECIDFRNKKLKVYTLKRKDSHVRTIPMTNRLVLAFSVYIPSLKNKTTYYLFPHSKDQNRHLSRITVAARLKRLGKRFTLLKGLHPHMLRHTFATRLVNSDVNLSVAKDLLGHKSISNTEIYVHTPEQRLREGIQAIDQQKVSFWHRLMSLLGFVKKSNPVNFLSPIVSKYYLVGRETELEKVNDALNRKYNLIILGAQGTGKTYLLESIKAHEKILRIDDLSTAKKTLIEIIKHLLQGYANVPFAYDIGRLQRNSISALTKLITGDANNPPLIPKDDFTLLIDDVSHITPTAIKLLENLNSHFHIICTARNIPVNKASFLTNFEKLEMKNLSRENGLLLIENLSMNLQNTIEDYTHFKNHIFEQTDGNPQFIFEMINRYSKEKFITKETVSELRHTAARQEWDMTYILLILFASLVVLRYLGREIDESGYQLIGGIALIIVLFGRSIFRSSKRKFV